MREAKINLPHQVGVNVYWQLWEGDKLRQGWEKRTCKGIIANGYYAKITHA